MSEIKQTHHLKGAGSTLEFTNNRKAKSFVVRDANVKCSVLLQGQSVDDGQPAPIQGVSLIKNQDYWGSFVKFTIAADDSETGTLVIFEED